MRSEGGAHREARVFVVRALTFVLVGAGLYSGLYAGAETLVRRYAARNRFYAVQTADQARYDFLILGASHSAVFDYRDLNTVLEELTEASVLNLSTLGAGLTLNRLLLEYFLEEHETDVVVYVLDSFTFYSSAWNEERLRDPGLFLRAPWDPSLARLLLSRPAGRRVALDYVLGFSKINDPDRFLPDSFPGEGSSFDRTFRPVPQIDRQRIDFLYPQGGDLASPTTQRYWAEFEELISYVRSAGAAFVVVRPPIPARIRDAIPAEDDFDAALRTLLDRLGVLLYDFSRVNNDESLFYDSDHLNREGALRFLEEHLAPALRGLDR